MNLQILGYVFTRIQNNGKIIMYFTKEKKWGYIMQTNIYTLNKEVECLKQQLYDLLDNEPWAEHDILRISERLDDLILQFYSLN